MHLVLVPGLWLPASTWDRVVPLLEAAGHTVHPLALPGTESPTADRSSITAQDHVDAIVAAVDAVDPAAGPVVLVGHSVGGALAWAAVDARPERVARIVFVASEPRSDGEATADGLPEADGEVPMPDWSAFDDDELRGLDEQLRAELRGTAVPAPLRVTRDPLRLADDRRLDVPATFVTCEYPSSMLRGMVEEGDSYTAEIARMRDVTWVDLGTGHWPQLSKPDELAAAILDAVAAPGVGTDPS
jgi:pimeloyl-ACP methyl ester carboxylesterase